MLEILTTDGGACRVDLSNLRVHIDQISLFCDLLVPRVGPLIDPVSKGLCDERMYHVCYVRSRHLLDLFAYYRKSSHHIRVLLCKCQHILDGKALKLGHIDHLHVDALDHPALPGYQISQMKDGNRLVRAEVGPHLTCEKTPDLPFTAEFGSKSGCIDLYYLWSLVGHWFISFHFYFGHSSAFIT